MSLTFFPQETNTIFLQVLRPSGSVPSFPSDYSTPQLRILHIDSGVVEDVSFTNMIQQSDNVWSFEFDIPSSPFFGNYFTEFQTTIDSIAIESSEIFKVAPPPTIVGQGQGSCEMTANVQNEVTTNPEPGVTVFVFDPGDLVNAIATDVTDASGNYTVFLNPGNYKIRFTKVNFIDETHDLEILANCTHVITGD